MADEDQGAAERHATWIELFFDLVVVAGVAQLAHLLSHEPSLGDLGLYALLYLAFWICWASFTIYGNVQAERVRVPNMLLAMLGLAIMVAAVPGIRDEHTDAFVIAYVGLRWLAGSVYPRGEVVVDWPLSQYGAGALPWLASLFVPEGARYWLWTAGIAIDLFALIGASPNGMLQVAQRKIDRLTQRLERSRSTRRPEIPTIQPAHTDSAHLAERMGLFVIIVLGEGVIQVITAVSETAWTLPLDIVALGGFALLVGIWTVSLWYGLAGVPGMKTEQLAPRHAMIMHAVLTGAIAALAAGLGAAVLHNDEPLPTGTRWLLCGGLATYFLVRGVGGALIGSGTRWVLGWAAPCTAGALLLGALANGVSPSVLIWLLTALVGWQMLYPPLAVRQRADVRL